MPDTKMVLIIDDNQDSIDFTEAMLLELGEFDVISATNGFLGLEKAKELRPNLIVLDIQMPGLNGFQVFKELKKYSGTKDIPVIMLTGITGDKELKHTAQKVIGLTLGSEPEVYINKPVEPQKFQKVVSEILGL